MEETKLAEDAGVDQIDAGLEAAPEPGPLPRLVRIPGGYPEAQIDAFVQEALEASTVEGTVRVRMQPSLYFGRSLSKRQRYDPWPGVNWVVDVTPGQAVEFRKALDQFVQDWVLGKQGI